MLIVVVIALLMFIVAILSSMLGVGGGVLYTPIQAWAGVEFQTAAATSLFLIMVVSLSASLVFRKARKIDWPLTIILESVTILGGFLGGLYSANVPASVLSLVFALVAALAGVLMISFPLSEPSARRQRWRVWGWQRRVGDRTYRVDLGIGLPVSFLAGLASGMVGVGGGILKVPVMVLLLGVPLDIAIGSSALMIGLTAAAGFSGHLINGHWDWRSSLLFAVVVFAGGQIGSRISIRQEQKKLKFGFGCFLLCIAAAMIVTGIVRLKGGLSP